MTKFVFIFFAFMQFALAQKTPMKYGRPTKEELEMKVCPFDSNAAAMVLCDYGYFKAENIEFNRMLRIKIFKKEGYDWADFKNKWYYENPQISGITFNMDSGKVVEQKLKSSAIFKKNGKKNSVYVSFTMPDVKVGSVIDVRINYKGFPKDWYFQNEIPTAWSELYVENSQYLRFKQNFFGYEPMFIAEESRWVSKNVPAFVKEPYLNCIENYITKCEFELLDINYPDYHKTFNDTWETLNEALLVDEKFGQAMGFGLYLGTTARRIIENSKTELDKIVQAHSYIRALKWNGDFDVRVSKNNLGDVYDANNGNSADLNLMLVMLLRKLDFEAHPLVMSTTDNGKLSKYTPSENRLNYVLAHVKLSDGTRLNLDATENLLPYNLLPERCFNGFGVLVKSGKAQFIDIEPTKSFQKTTFYNISLDEDLAFKGTITNTRQDYDAYSFRDRYYSFNGEEEFISAFKQERPGLKVTSFKINNLDSIAQNVKDVYNVIIENKVEEVGGEVYFNPNFYEARENNPFKLENRKYPVDWGVAEKLNYTANIILPDKYTTVQLPKSLVLKTPDNGASFMYQVTQNGNNLLLNSKFSVTKPIFYAEDYLYLKEFFDRVVKKTNEPVILKLK